MKKIHRIGLGTMIAGNTLVAMENNNFITVAIGTLLIILGLLLLGLE